MGGTERVARKATGTILSLEHDKSIKEKRSRMTGDYHVRCCESLGQGSWATRPQRGNVVKSYTVPYNKNTCISLDCPKIFRPLTIH